MPFVGKFFQNTYDFSSLYNLLFHPSKPKDGTALDEIFRLKTDVSSLQLSRTISIYFLYSYRFRIMTNIELNIPKNSKLLIKTIFSRTWINLDNFSTIFSLINMRIDSMWLFPFQVIHIPNHFDRFLSQ